MESATDQPKPEPPKRGRPEDRLKIDPEDAGDALDQLLKPKPEPESPDEDDPKPKKGK